jgi:hypothetical protein
MSTGGKIGLGCGGCLGVLLILGLLVACVSVLSDDSAAPPAPTASSAEDAPEDTAAEEEPADEPAEDAADTAVTMTATSAGTVGDTIDDTVYTAIDIEIVNDSDTEVDVNPLYFTAELADGTVVSDWADALFADIDPIDAVTLQPGQRASGQIAVVGEVEVASVTMEDLIGLDAPLTATVE